MVIDHQKKSTRIQASCLLRMKKKNNASLLALTNYAATDRSRAAAASGFRAAYALECNQSDEEFGGVVRLLQKAIAPEKFSRWCHLAVSLCPARPAGGLLRAEKE